jgi:hypothetical protein
MVDQERLFFSQSLLTLSTLSGRTIQVEDWMITNYEVDFIEEIGSGGLYVIFYYIELCCKADRTHLYSGQVFRGNWSKTEIALKVLKADSGVSPRNDVRHTSAKLLM